MTSGVPTFRAVFERIEKGALGPDDVRAAFGAILSGAWTPVQIGAFATSLRMRGESADTIAAAADALRAVMTPVDHGLADVIDTCGTGGDGAHTVNVSTAAAIVVAACGVFVAKHGNRSVSSRCGSADVLEALGIPVDVAPERHSAILREAKITFMMAPVHHPALRHAAEARRELGVRTIFNALGPLVNPARTNYQLVGVYDDAIRSAMAGALAKVGVTRAWVVRGEDGLDEISPAAPTRVSVLENGVVTERVISPADFGLAPASVEHIRGGNAETNAASMLRLFRGDAEPSLSVVIANAAAALAVARGGTDLRAYADEARTAIASGGALATLAHWKAVVSGAKGKP